MDLLPFSVGVGDQSSTLLGSLERATLIIGPVIEFSFEKWMFPSSCEGKETSKLMGPLEGVNISHWNNYWANGPIHKVSSF
jgi:hypothetical protein